MATNRFWKDADGQAHEEADWHNIVLWRAENLAPYLVNGKQVYVEGRLTTRSWDDQDGNRRYTTEVIAAEVILLGGSNGNGSESRTQPPEQSESPHKEGARNASAPAKRSGSPSSAGRSVGRDRSGNARHEPPPDVTGVAEHNVPFDGSLRGR